MSEESIQGREIQIDENRKATGFIPAGGGIQFDFWSGAVRSTIRLSDEAFHAAIQIYTELQRDKTKSEEQI